MTLAAAQDLPRTPARAHIIDVLIAERAPRLAASPAWPLARPLLNALLGYRQAREMADTIAALPGEAALAHVSRQLDLRVEARGLDRTPAAGRLVVVCNHPTGIADGIAVRDALSLVREDLCFYANADALRVSPRFGEVLIPVEWVASKRSREKARRLLEATRNVLEAERALVVFPAGRLARRQADGRLADPPWAPTAVSIARRHAAPVLPIHLSGPWSTLFHLFHKVSPELRDITLFHELLNKRGGRFRLTVGPLIPAEALAGDAVGVTERLKRHVEQRLAADPNAAFA
jgi:putative hemolysin